MHLSIIHLLPLFWGRVGGQQSKRGSPDFPRPTYFVQLFWGDPAAFPGQLRDIAPPVCSGCSPRPPTGGMCPKRPPGRRLGGIPTRRPSQLIWLFSFGSELDWKPVQLETSPTQCRHQSYREQMEEFQLGELYNIAHTLGCQQVIIFWNIRNFNLKLHQPWWLQGVWISMFMPF